jgi:predicted ATP-binding protein involved in virulence
MTKATQEIKLTGQREPTDYPPAYFLSIELENVLCFKTYQKLDLSDANGFPAQWTVILGDNGVGKTTLLRCLANMEPHSVPFPKGTIFPRVETYSDSEQEVPALWIEGEHSITATFGYGVSLKNCSNSSQKTEHKEPIFQTAHTGVSVSVSATKIMTVRDDLLGLKCYGYGASRRLGNTLLSNTLSSDRCSSLFLEDAELINAEEWLLQADYAVVRSVPGNTARLEQRFHLIQDILKQLLPNISDIRISPADYDNPRPVAEFLTSYGWVPLKSLSLGYKTVIAWTVDLAVRLMDRYPQSEYPLAEPAVVLVDEIDLHLHPKWQRTIMSFLSERFPNTQFIVTAHSPLVVQAAKNANIVLLRREGDHVVIDNDPEIIDNWRVEQVLSSVFELPSPHSPDIAPLIERRRKLLAKSKLTAKDERELKKLEAQIGTIPTAESPEDIRAMDIIRKAAKLLENS